MVAFHDDLGELMQPIDDVLPAPYNYNNGDVDVIAKSIEMNGMYRPIYVQSSTRYIIAGNHTWLACKELGAEKIPVVRLDVDDTTAKRIMIEDNEAARQAQPDKGLLLSLLREIHDDTGKYLASITQRDVEVLEALNEIPLDTQEFATWPSLSLRLPPHVLRGYMWMTRETDDEPDSWRRLELLLRLAGWDGDNE
jgi:ParB-like chromosome segregation protein Spo0J